MDYYFIPVGLDLNYRYHFVEGRLILKLLSAIESFHPIERFHETDLTKKAAELEKGDNGEREGD